MDRFLQLCDDVAPQLLPFGEFNQHTFLRDHKELKIEQRDFEHVLYHLEADGYVNRIATSSYEFTLTGKGRVFISAGCYANKIKVDKATEQLTKEQIESAIITNSSIKATNKTMAIFTGALLIISLLGLVREILKDRPTSTQELLLQKKLQIIENALQSQSNRMILLEHPKYDSLTEFP